MHLVDWAIVVCMLIFMTAAAIGTKRYMRGVADFLAANRCGGRYILSISDGIAGLGAISLVGMFEMYYNNGFPAAWWAGMMGPIGAVITLSGWVIYRYRQTRAMTLGQFFEIRYSKGFRIYAGTLCWVSGILNFGIFPAVGARFFLYYCGLPPMEVELWSGYSISITFALIMIILLAISLYFTFLGGQVAVIVTDFFQGIFCNIMFVILLVALFVSFSWDGIVDALMQAPAEQSMIHPFHTSESKDFNVWYFLIGAFGLVYGAMSWQGNQAYYCSAKSPHEARMARVMGTWRGITQMILIIMLPLCAYALMHHPDYAARAASVQEGIASIGSEQLQGQLTVPISLRHMFPIGLMGGFCAVMLAAFISTHDTYLHSWGSLFIQDVVLPFRKNPFTPEGHVKLLRWSIFGVAVFIFLFSLFFPQNEFILMFFAATGTIFLGGAGAAIVGGLYWKRGTTAAAYTAMSNGLILAIGGLAIRDHVGKEYVMDGVGLSWWVWVYAGCILLFGLLFARRKVTAIIAALTLGGVGLLLRQFVGVDAPHSLVEGYIPDPQKVFMMAMGSSSVLYILVSFLGQKGAFNMDRMLHRGEYAVQTDVVAGTRKPVSLLNRVFGIGEEFSRGDKIIYIATIAWMALWSGVFIIGTIYNLLYDVPVESWAQYWRFYVTLCLILGTCTTAWFVVGGLRDIKEMFRLLRERVQNDADDGTVVDHHSLADDAPAVTQEAPEESQQ
ncbi:MAG: sodium:solute symporter [bacterium]|nr:sodium:solute symporter [bacterium]